MPGSSFPEELAFLRCVVSLPSPPPPLPLPPSLTELIFGAPNMTSQFKDSDVILSQFLPPFGIHMCPFDGKKGQKKMQMFLSIWYLLVLTLLRERFDLFSMRTRKTGGSSSNLLLGKGKAHSYILRLRWRF